MISPVSTMHFLIGTEHLWHHSYFKMWSAAPEQNKLTESSFSRVDSIIELPLPQAEQRFHFIARRSIDLFSAFLISESRTALESYLPHARRPSSSEISPLSSYLDGHTSVSSAQYNVDLLFVNEYDCYIHDVHFNVVDCVSRLVLCSESWSLRDVSKILTNIRSEVLGTERCDLS